MDKQGVNIKFFFLETPNFSSSPVPSFQNASLTFPHSCLDISLFDNLLRMLVLDSGSAFSICCPWQIWTQSCSLAQLLDKKCAWEFVQKNRPHGLLSILFSEFWQPCRLHNMMLVSKIVKSEIKPYDLGIKIVECGDEIWCFLWTNLQASMGSVCWSLDLRQGWALGLGFGNVRTIGKSEDVLFLLLKWKEVSKVHKLLF